MRSGGGARRTPWAAPRDHRQGRLLRLGRDLDQALRADGRDEDGQDRCMHGVSAIATVAELAPGTPLLAVAPAVENMPGPHSTRPGDLVRALNGKWVEITNTDAEGRLILGDAMTYAERLGATHLVDVATLTGAVGADAGPPRRRRVRDAAGVLRRGDAAARLAGERFWQMPLVDEYLARPRELDRRHRQLGHGRGVAREERHVPARVRDRAVGPPRHRRHGVLPQVAAVGAARRDGDVACDAGRAGDGRAAPSGADGGASKAKRAPRRTSLGPPGSASHRRRTAARRPPRRQLRPQPARGPAARGPAPDPGRARHPRVVRGRRPHLGPHLRPDRAPAGRRTRMARSGRSTGGPPSWRSSAPSRCMHWAAASPTRRNCALYAASSSR